MIFADELMDDDVSDETGGHDRDKFEKFKVTSRVRVIQLRHQPARLAPRFCTRV